MKRQEIIQAIKKDEHIEIQTKCAELSHKQATPHIIFLYETASPTQRMELINELSPKLRNTWPGIFTFYCQHYFAEEQLALLKIFYTYCDYAAGPFVSWLIIHGHASTTKLAVRTLFRVGDSRIVKDLKPLEFDWSQQNHQTFGLGKTLQTLENQRIIDADDPVYYAVKEVVQQFSDPTGWTYGEKQTLAQCIASSEHKNSSRSKKRRDKIFTLAKAHEADSNTTNLMDVITLLSNIKSLDSIAQLVRIWHTTIDRRTSYAALEKISQLIIDIRPGNHIRQIIHDKMPGLTTNWEAKMTLYTLTMPVDPQPWIEAFDKNKKGVQKHHILPLFYHGVSQDVLDRIEHYFKRIKPNIRRGHLRQLTNRFHPDHLPLFINLLQTMEPASRKILTLKLVDANMIMDDVFIHILSRHDEEKQVKLMVLEGLKNRGTRKALAELHRQLNLKELPATSINMAIDNIQSRYPMSDQKQGGISLQETTELGALSSVDAAQGELTIHDNTQNSESPPTPSSLSVKNPTHLSDHQLAAPPRKVSYLVKWTTMTFHANQAGGWIIAAIATLLFIQVLVPIEIFIPLVIVGCIGFVSNLYQTQTLNHLKILKTGFLGLSRIKKIQTDLDFASKTIHTVRWQIDDDNGKQTEFERIYSDKQQLNTDVQYPALYTVDEHNEITEIVLFNQNATLDIHDGHLKTPKKWVFFSLLVWMYLIGAIITLILV